MHRAGMTTTLLALTLTSAHALRVDGFQEQTEPSSQDPPPAQPSTLELLTELRALREQMREQEKRHSAELAALQDQINELKARGSGSSPPPSPEKSEPGSAEDDLAALIGGSLATAAEPQGTKPPGVFSLQGTAQSLNPDIGLNADFLGAYSSRERGELDDEFLFRELEINFTGAVDPFSRADIVVGIEKEEGEYAADLEEAYLTFLQMPHALQARVGKYRAEFGRANPVHRDAVPWIDYPFVILDYFGEEGLSGTGVELSWLVPNPGNQYVSLTYELFNNDNDALFAGEEADDFTHLLRVKTFRELTSASGLEFGASVATAPNDGGHGSHRSTVEGIDLTYHWKPQGQGLYKSFLWQNELLFGQADRRGNVIRVGDNEHSWGMYSAAEYQFARRWKFGLRYDLTELPYNSDRREVGYSTYLTFIQSEFVFWRLAYLYTDRNFKQDDVSDEQQLFLQLNWTMGAHPAHRY